MRIHSPKASSAHDFPSNVEDLVHPTADAPGEEHDRGFQRYGTAKLANVMFMHELNERLANVSAEIP